uniref:Prostaglandin E synthase 2 n=1 Tax=Panagrolaimus sp. PS1159 TaxID=55785 RepID=A0AC35FSB6_9BILA
MWARRALGTIRAYPIRAISTSGGALFGSVLYGVKEEKQQSWRVEYPKLVLEHGGQLSRKIINEEDKTQLGLRLYQYQTCPYCCKVRAVLDYYGFSYEVVEVNPVTRSQLKFSKEYKKVPILKTSAIERPIVESSLIISILSTFLHRPNRSFEDCVEFYPSHESTDPDTQKVSIKYPNQYFVMTEESKIDVGAARDEREWREWIDSHFIHLISPNVYRTWDESLETFRYFDKVGEWDRNFPTWERYLAVYMGAAAMWGISKRLKKRHNIDDERQAMKDACNKWLNALGGRKFMGGDQPNLADLGLYGAINSFVGCSAFKDMREETKIGEWYDAVHQMVIQKQGRNLVAAKSAATEKQIVK